MPQVVATSATFISTLSRIRIAYSILAAGPADLANTVVTAAGKIGDGSVKHVCCHATEGLWLSFDALGTETAVCRRQSLSHLRATVPWQYSLTTRAGVWELGTWELRKFKNAAATNMATQASQKGRLPAHVVPARMEVRYTPAAPPGTVKDLKLLPQDLCWPALARPERLETGRPRLEVGQTLPL